MSNANEIDAIGDEFTALMFETSPISATLAGLPGYDDRLPDRSAAADADRSTRAHDVARRAAALTPTDPEQAVTAAVVANRATAMGDEIDIRTIEHAMGGSIFGPATQLLSSLPMVTPTDDDGAEAYLARLAALPRYLDALLDRNRDGAAAGRVPVGQLVDVTVAQLDQYLADPDNDPLLRPVYTGADFDGRRRTLLADVVRPAYARYRQTLLDESAPIGRPSDRPGLCHLPDGDTAYATLARIHTTTDRTPDELHDTGLALIDDLHREYSELGSRAFGIDRPADVFARLREDPALRWDDAEQMLDAARAAIERAGAEAPNWFGTLPSQPCVVEAVPAAEAPGSAPAYYMAPSLDGTRPGTYFSNTYRVTERFRYTLESVAFHEAIPGHHFQISLAQQLDTLPLVRRLAKVNAYSEGWGLYTERLADEMGLYSDDVARFGMLNCDSMRAGRLVVDTGLHAKGWSRQQAIDFLVERTPMSPVEIASEVDRYIAMPGQALSYMVGRLEIQRMRAEAEQTLGERFDIRAFHDRILDGGALPLTVLAGRLRRR